MPVKEPRLALTAEDDDRALAFYRDTLGLHVLEAWSEPAGRVRSSTPGGQRSSSSTLSTPTHRTVCS